MKKRTNGFPAFGGIIPGRLFFRFDSSPITINLRKVGFLLLLLLASNFALAQWTQTDADLDGDAASDKFGYSVSLSSDGSRLAVGAPFNDAGGTSAGQVKVFEWDSIGLVWNQLGVDIIGEAALDFSGQGLKLSADGNRVAIGAPANDGGGADAGHARVYEWNGTSWTQLGADIDGANALDNFGFALSLSSDGSILAVGSYTEDSPYSNGGSLRIYQWNGSAWNQVGMTINGTASGQAIGESVALSWDGTIVATGGPATSIARVYQWDGMNWNQLGMDFTGDVATDDFAETISLSADGKRVAFGAPANDNGGFNTSNGQVSVFEWDSIGMQWNQLGADFYGANGDEMGGDRSVTLSPDGNKLAIGAPLHDNGGTNAGQVKVFEWDSIGMQWTQLGADMYGEAGNDEFGSSVSLSADGSIIAVGGPGNDGAGPYGSNVGHVRSFGYTSPPPAESGNEEVEPLPLMPGWQLLLGALLLLGLSAKRAGILMRRNQTMNSEC